MSLCADETWNVSRDVALNLAKVIYHLKLSLPGSRWHTSVATLMFLPSALFNCSFADRFTYLINYNVASSPEHRQTDDILVVFSASIPA